MTLDHLKHPPPNSPGWLVQATLPCRPGSNKGASWTTMAQDPGLYVPMSKVTPKMTRSSQSKITTTSNNSYTKMLLLVVGDIGYPEVLFHLTFNIPQSHGTWLMWNGLPLSVLVI